MTQNQIESDLTVCPVKHHTCNELKASLCEFSTAFEHLDLTLQNTVQKQQTQINDLQSSLSMVSAAFGNFRVTSQNAITKQQTQISDLQHQKDILTSVVQQQQQHLIEMKSQIGSLEQQIQLFNANRSSQEQSDVHPIHMPNGDGTPCQRPNLTPKLEVSSITPKPDVSNMTPKETGLSTYDSGFADLLSPSKQNTTPKTDTNVTTVDFDHSPKPASKLYQEWILTLWYAVNRGVTPRGYAKEALQQSISQPPDIKSPGSTDSQGIRWYYGEIPWDLVRDLDFLREVNFNLRLKQDDFEHLADYLEYTEDVTMYENLNRAFTKCDHDYTSWASSER